MTVAYALILPVSLGATGLVDPLLKAEHRGLAEHRGDRVVDRQGVGAVVRCVGRRHHVGGDRQPEERDGLESAMRMIGRAEGTAGRG